MKRKILWMLLSFLLVAALVLASCAKEVPGEQEEEEEKPVGEQEEEEEEPVGEQEEEEEEEPVVGEPQYGGTLTVLGPRATKDPASWDLFHGDWGLVTFVAPFAERLLVGDVEKYGRRGTNEFAFQTRGNVPDQFVRGQLAESWELTIDPLGVLFHIRPGVMWTGNANIGMESREYTAADAAFAINRMRLSSRGIAHLGYMPEDGAEALDRYTVQVTFSEFVADWPLTYYKSFFGPQYPPEVVAAGATDWRNQVGTGAFILTEVVRGSVATYERNPMWWDRERIIGGEAYDTPFIDTLVFPIIPDASTQVAALRTGKIDLTMGTVAMRYKETLASTSPELIVEAVGSGIAELIMLQAAPGLPFEDVNLRRALMIGLDLETILKLTHIDGEIHALPFSIGYGPDIYTSVEDLPPETKLLFDYNPDLARQMIIDAGYPDGLEISLTFPTGIWGTAAQSAPLIKEMWAKIGVELSLQPFDLAVYYSKLAAGDFEYLTLARKGVTMVDVKGIDIRTWEWLPHDEYLREMTQRVMAIVDETERNALLKEIGIYLTDKVGHIPLGEGVLLSAYWPWLKNYYGETEVAFETFTPMLATLWIDQDLKADMGY